MERALEALEDLTNVVQAEARSQVAQVAGGNPERLGRLRDAPARQAPTNGVVHDVAKRPAGRSRLRAEFCRDVLVEGQGRTHIMMLKAKHHDVKPFPASSASSRSSGRSRTPAGEQRMPLCAAPPYRSKKKVEKPARTRSSLVSSFRNSALLFDPQSNPAIFASCACRTRPVRGKGRAHLLL